MPRGRLLDLMHQPVAEGAQGMSILDVHVAYALIGARPGPATQHGGPAAAFFGPAHHELEGLASRTAAGVLHQLSPVDSDRQRLVGISSPQGAFVHQRQARQVIQAGYVVRVHFRLVP